jgi:two-component system C4-dicarboxylate transport response regulator DctD
MPPDVLGVLLVEDDPAVLHGAAQALRLAGIAVNPCSTGEQALALLRADYPGVVVSDVRLPGIDGMELMRRAHALDRELPVALVTGHGDISMAVQAMRDGAYEFVEKPFASERLVEVAQRAIEQRRLVLENRRLRKALAGVRDDEIVGQSPAIERLRNLVGTLGPTDVDVLIVGETGTGKEVAARALHRASGRKGPFVAINCGALPEHVFESEIFGHEPGAFTGAQKRRIGKIEHSHHGTLFLDEIETMPLQLQVKLLRVLQERRVERLGGNEQVAVDCRVVAASKADLKELSDRGGFRGDLYYRLNVAAIELAPLRERREDIPLLFAHFARLAAQRYEREMPPVTPALVALLMNCQWPGNVRELRNAADRFILGLDAAPLAGHEPQPAASLAERVDAFERALIQAELRRLGGNVARVAAALSMPRKTLYDKLTRHGIDPEGFREDATA